MSFVLARPVRFALQLVPLFLLCLWVYPRILPAYEPLVLRSANAIARGLSPQTRIESRREGGWHSYVTEVTGEERHVFSWPGFVPHLIYLGLVFLPALLLATPVPFRQRLWLLALGLILLFGVHVLSLVLLVRAKYCLLTTPGTFTCLWMLRLVYASGQLSGAVLWVALTWRHWLPGDWLAAVSRPAKGAPFPS